MSIFGAYQLIVFAITVFMESKKTDLQFLFKVFNSINLFKYGALIGVALIVIEFLWVRKESQTPKP